MAFKGGEIVLVKKIGVISDTHGLIRDEINEFFKECDLIIHAGDIVSNDVILGLQKICKVESVKGNNDYLSPVNKYPDYKEIIVNDNIKIFVIHDINLMNESYSNYNIVIHGHTHRPMEEYKGKTLILNPGSFGPKRFSLPISLATIDLNGSDFYVKFYEIQN